MKYVLLLCLIVTTVYAGSPGKKTISNSNIILTDGNVLVLNQPVTDQSIGPLLKDAAKLSRGGSREPIYLFLNTPGGSIEAGINAVEYLSSLSRPVHTISMFSASMGFHMVQGLGKRYVLSKGVLMSHRASGTFSGEFPGQVDSRYNFVLRRIMKMDEQVVARTNGKYTLASYEKLIEHEYWCEGQDCINNGFADEIGHATCSDSLAGTHVVVDRFSFLGMQVEVRVEMANCPINQGIINVTSLVNGKEIYPSASSGSFSIQKLFSTDAAKLDPATLNEINARIKERLVERFGKVAVGGAL